MQGVGFEDAEEHLLPGLAAKLGVLWEGAVDVPLDDVINLLLPHADLQQRVVLPILCTAPGLSGLVQAPHSMHSISSKLDLQLGDVLPVLCTATWLVSTRSDKH